MLSKKRELPSVNQLGRILSERGLVSFGRSAFNQTTDNCFEVACEVARHFGYVPISSRAELLEIIKSKRQERFWGNRANPEKPSTAYLVVRIPDEPINFHTSFELYGREYSYGPGTREGVHVDMRIPLVRD